MDQSQEEAVLVFCKTCGSRKVQEVTKELQKLFTERTIKPNICGICQNPVEPQNDSKCAVVNIKKEVITDDDFEVINFNSHMSKTPKTATTDSKIMRDDHARATRLSTGALVQSASYVSKSGDSTEGDDSVSEKSSDSADSDGDDDDEDDDDGEEDEMVVDLDKMIKEEESTAAKRPKITVRRLNITDRKHLDPELLKFLAPSDEPKMFVCNVCQDSTKQIAAFAKHVATHTNKEPILRPYRCHECRKSYEARGFRKHMNANHVTLFKCTHSKCRFTFKNKKALNGHMDFHKGVRKHACKVCGLAFLERRELGRHKANHGDESFTCEICMKSFNHIRKLRSHTRRMHMDNKHKCELCPYSCFTKEDLEKHMEMHPKTNLTCETCQHIFTSKAGFDFHLEINACIVPEEKTSADDLKMDANVAVQDESTAGGVVAMVTVKDEPKADGDAVLTEILQFLDAGLVTHMAKPTDPSRPFRCKHCNDRDFISAVWLLQHIQLSHPLEDCSVTHLYHCNKCSSKFEHRCDITKHWKTHSDHRPYVCSYENCSKAFKRKDVLTRHHETHISGGDKLKSSTLTEEDIEEVMQYLDPKLRALLDKPRSKEFPFSCKHCDMKEFQSAYICLNHIKQKHPEILIDCSVTHVYKCNECEQAFEQKNALSRHKLSHSDYKPYVCSVEGCDRAFKRKDKLKQHEDLHATGGKRVMCSTCGIWFSSSSGLKTHIKNVHLKIHDHKCLFCGKTFPKESMKKHHENTKHLGVKEWVCEQCGKSYNKKSALNQHMYYHSGEKPYACDYCEYRCVRLDYLKKHIKTHTSEAPYQCGVCSRAFSLRATLVIHMKKFHGSVSPEKIEKMVVPIAIRKRPGPEPHIDPMTAAGSLIPSTSGKQHFVVDETAATSDFLQVFKEACNVNIESVQNYPLQ